MNDARQQRAVRLSKPGIDAVAKLAEQEQRTWSDMLRILLSEALAARQQKRGRA